MGWVVLKGADETMEKFVVTASAVKRLKPLLQTHQNTLDRTLEEKK